MYMQYFRYVRLMISCKFIASVFFVRERSMYVFMVNKCRCLKVIEHVQAGDRLTRPAGCPRDVYGVMARCWQRHPSDRPRMAQIRRLLDDLRAYRMSTSTASRPGGATDCDSHSTSGSQRDSQYLEVLN